MYHCQKLSLINTYILYMSRVLSTEGRCLHMCISASLRNNSETSPFLAMSFCLLKYVISSSVLSSPGLSPPSYSFTPALPILSAETAHYPPMGQVLLTPRPLPQGHHYVPTTAQLYMNYTAYYPR